LTDVLHLVKVGKSIESGKLLIIC